MLRACRNRGLPRQTHAPQITVRRAGFSRRNRSQRSVLWSFAPRGRFADDLFIPPRVVALGKGDGNIAADDGAERSAFSKHTHVNVDQEEGNREESRNRMDEHGDVAQEAQVPRNVFREPENDTGRKQRNRAPEKSPEEKLLA